MNRWYVVHTQIHAEDRAKSNLERQNFEVYLPKYQKFRRHARRVDRVRRPLFPRYLFVRFDPDRSRWRAISGTVGVTHLVSHGEQPTAVPDKIVDAIKARHNDSGLVVLNSPQAFRPGQKLEIVDGPLAWHSAVFERLDDNERVVVLLELLGRQVNVTVSTEAVAVA